VVAAACSNSNLHRDATLRSGSTGETVAGGPAGSATQGSVVSDSVRNSATGRQGAAGTVPRGATADAASGQPGSPSNASGTIPVVGSTVGVTKSSVTISVSAPFSGVYAAPVGKVYTGVETWQREVNTNGGIYGRQINLIKVDNQLSAEGATTACKEAKSNGSFMVVNLKGFTAETDCEDAAGLPVFDNQPSYLKPWKGVFANMHPPLFAPAEVSFLKSSWMGAGTKKIGIVYLGDQAENKAEYEAVAAELRQQGLQLVDAEKVTTNQASFVAEMSRMQASGAQTVLLYVNLEGPGIVRDAKAIGYTPQWFGGTLGTSNDLSAKAGNEQFRGLRALRPYTTTDTPAFAAYVEKVRKYEGDSAAQSADAIDMPGYAFFDILGQMLKLTGPNLTRQTFVAGAKTIDHYDNHLLGSFTLKGKNVPVGLSALFPIECCAPNYTYKGLGPAQERF
jgi:ABC-type branched-subunit amino acid transport system substrate-binding protein